MSDNSTLLSHCLISQRLATTAIATHAGRYYSFEQFACSVKFWVNTFQTQPTQRYALYTNDAYPFAILLFALLHAGKEVWIPGNNRPGIAQQLPQDCALLGDWHNEPVDYHLQAPEYSSVILTPINPLANQLVIFTSGSTGQPKPIAKCLQQFQLEVTELENQWGDQLGNAEALSSLSHQHIYGLLFRVCWPLAAGRCFHSQASLTPETLINTAGSTPAYWIASPAHLKRLDQHSPWQGIANLKAIFSSGGALPESAAQQIMTFSGQSVLEIYGSSETGGIAWRQQDRAWTLFPGMRLAFDAGCWWLHSPYLEIPLNPPFTKGGDFQLDDQLTLLDNGRFILHGRSDRIVKIEEKRLSLTELEQRLAALPWIAEAHALVITNHRDVVAVIIALNQQGLQHMTTQNRHQFIKQLRRSLEPWFEAVVLPRKWLFVNTLPSTPPGKIDQRLLTSLLDYDSKKFPQVLTLAIIDDSIVLGLKVPNDLVYFADHFADYPILPGVVQLAWAAHFGQLFFTLEQPSQAFSHMELIKFLHVIKPGDELTLTLNWQAEVKKLAFNFSSNNCVHSSGRMVYNR